MMTATVGNPVLGLGASWTKALINPYGAGEVLADVACDRVIPVENLDAANDLVVRLKEAADAGNTAVTGMPSNFRIARIRAVDRGYNGAFVVVSWARDDVPAMGAAPLPAPFMWGNGGTEKLYIPETDAYTDGQACRVDADGHYVPRLAERAYQNIYWVQEQTASSYNFTAANWGKTSGSSWHGLGAETVLFVGSSVVAHLITAGTIFYRVVHQFLWRQWLGDVSAVKSHATIYPWYDTSANLLKIKISAPSTGTFPV